MVKCLQIDYTRKIGGTVLVVNIAAGKRSMPKALCISGIVVAALLLLVFGLDLAIGIPFNKANTTMDIGFIVCSGILGYLSWSTFREQV